LNVGFSEKIGKVHIPRILDASQFFNRRKCIKCNTVLCTLNWYKADVQMHSHVENSRTAIQRSSNVFPHLILSFNCTGWHNDNALDLYSGDGQFISQLGHWLS
jgi:hypothetical protein